jgi:hypothetical protein
MSGVLDAQSLTTANIAAEAAYVEGKGRVSFERPYGLPRVPAAIRRGS